MRNELSSYKTFVKYISLILLFAIILCVLKITHVIEITRSYGDIFIDFLMFLITSLLAVFLSRWLEK
jgi:hypothetical protein